MQGLEAAGWWDEGVKFYGSADTTYPVYRLWNSGQTADGGLGSHLWTLGFNEYTVLPKLPPVGTWKPEGVVWYAVDVPA